MGKGQAGAKKSISGDGWERRLEDVMVEKKDMNRIVMDFLVTEGFFDAATAFALESGAQAEVDLSTITERMKIRQAVQGGKLEEAIDRVNDLNPEILESNRELYFHIQQLRMIELIRSKRFEEALQFAQDELASQGEENQAVLEELEKTIALLAFENPESSPLGYLLDTSQRSKTASELNAAILQSQNQQKVPKLPMLLKMLIWAQKQLDQKLQYPRITDLVKATLDDSDLEH